jgi:chemotaxis protein CheD
MFAFNATNDTLRIGDRNVEATLRLLKNFNIPLLAQETGANFGRTVELYSDDGRFVIKSVGRGVKTV